MDSEVRTEKRQSISKLLQFNNKLIFSRVRNAFQLILHLAKICFIHSTFFALHRQRETKVQTVLACIKAQHFQVKI